MSHPHFIFRRPRLAASVADGLAGAGLPDYRSGLFLTAPRRTGKSTFLKEDLIPECLERKWVPIYVDLWENREADPAALIAKAIAGGLLAYEGAVRKLIKKTGATQLNVMRWVSWDFTRPSLPEGITLTEAFQLLGRASGKMAILIVDEAQHALNSDTGVNAMFALKAARDALNASGEAGLRLVMTGSSRDKLAQLVLKKSQPFYGSDVTPFPMLGQDFVIAFTSHINANLAHSNRFDQDDVLTAFDLVGRRPELLRSLIGSVALEMGAARDLGRLMREGALTQRAGVWDEFEGSYKALPPVQRAVLDVMAERRAKQAAFTPYAESTLADVRTRLESNGDEAAVSAASAQSALEALREKDLIWKQGRGGYAFEDEAMAEWIYSQRSI